MSSLEISEYYEATEFRAVREDLAFAVDIVSEPKIAVDCGCGAGSDISYLLDRGFTVHGFDLEKESIIRCKSRFNATKKYSYHNHPLVTLITLEHL